MEKRQIVSSNQESNETYNDTGVKPWIGVILMFLGIWLIKFDDSILWHTFPTTFSSLRDIGRFLGNLMPSYVFLFPTTLVYWLVLRLLGLRFPKGIKTNKLINKGDLTFLGIAPLILWTLFLLVHIIMNEYGRQASTL